MTDTELMTEQKSNDTGYMKKYLKLALEIETDKIIWEDALKTHKAHLENTRNKIAELQNTRKNGDIFERTKDSIRSSLQEQIATLEKRKKEEEKNEKKKRKKKKVLFFCILAVMTAIVYFCYPFFDPRMTDLIFVLRLVVAILVSSLGVMIVMVPIGLFLAFVRHLLELDNNKSEITQQEITRLQITLNSMAREEKEVIANKQYIDSTLPEMQKKQAYLVNMINHIDLQLDESERVRNMIYDDGVLHQAYQNIVSVASLYQFLEKGICTQIKGHGGIYDTYEYHLKLNDINTNLVEIRKDLCRIQANQEFLYDKLCDVHKTLESINAGIDSAAKEIVSNTAIAAEAAQRTAVAQEWRNREIWYRS